MQSLILKEYKHSNNRLFLFDYDGTLTGLQPTPDMAVPSQDLLDTLDRLSSCAENQVVIVSGRDRKTMDKWFSAYPISFVAEHGSFIKDYGSHEWQPTSDKKVTWKTPVRKLFKEAVKLVPGALVEDKTFSVVWHYRRSRSDKVTPVLKKLREQLKPILKDNGLVALTSHKALEVKYPGINKSLAANHWLKKHRWDFILAAGDDNTDEDLFRAMPDNSFTIKVGKGKSLATYHLPSPKSLSELLKEMNTT